jgi:uncharacterized protein YggT (Ycf19 family)
MKSRSTIHNFEVSRRFLFAIFVVLQCTIKRGNAFRIVVITSPPSRVRNVNSNHHAVPAFSTSCRSPSIRLRMNWSGNDDNPLSLIPALLIAAGTTTSQTEPWVQPLSNVLDPFLNFMSFAMLSRVVLSWYPEIIASNSNNNNNNNSNDTPPPVQKEETTTVTSATTDSLESNESNAVSDSSKNTSKSEKPSLPIWITLIVIPTQPFLQAVKDIVPPAFGVDITPVFWLAIFTFIHEIFLGQQGLLTMKIKYGI